MEYINNKFFNIEILDDIEIKKIDTEFLGSRNRKLFGLHESVDYLYSYETNNKTPFKRFDNGKKVESTVFDFKHSNTYNFYMGGDKAETIIKTNRPNLKNVLILGDSFTNPLETLFYHSFNEMRSLDLRYYKEATLYEYLESYKPDLIIYVIDDMSIINPEGNGNFN